MKVLLTGSTGMLGRAILRTADPAVAITAMVRDLGQIHSLEKDSLSKHQKYVVANLADEDSLIRACADIDVIVHCAALASPWGRKRDYELVNVQGTENLLHAAAIRFVPRMVFISSPSVYFDYQNASQISERQNLPGQFCSYYARSKAIAESLVRQSDIESIILRPRGIFGPYDRVLVPRILAAIRKNQLLLPSHRDPLIDMTYVDNVALAVNSALKADAEEGIFNISNGQPLHLRAMLRLLLERVAPDTEIKTLPYGVMSRMAALSETTCRLLPGHPEPPLTRYSAGLFHFDQSLCIDKAVTRLEYQPIIDVEEGICRYAHWYRANGGES